jgi:hypothetical protein
MSGLLLIDPAVVALLQQTTIASYIPELGAKNRIIDEKFTEV